MPSVSLTRLNNRLGEVRALQALVPPPGARLPGTRTLAVGIDAVNRASVVLLCSHLEGFVEDLVLEAIDGMMRSALRTKHVPTKLRFRHALADVRELANTLDPDKFVSSFDALFTKNQALLTSKRLRAGDLDGERLRAGFATPSVDAIRGIVSVLGVPPKAVMEEAMPFYRTRVHVINSIDSMVARRQEVAHGDMNAAVTQADVETYVAAVWMLGARLDALVERKLAQWQCRAWQ